MLPTNGALRPHITSLAPPPTVAPVEPLDVFGEARAVRRKLAQAHLSLQQSQDPTIRARSLAQLRQLVSSAPSARLRLQAQELCALHTRSASATDGTLPVPRAPVAASVPRPTQARGVPPLQHGFKRKKFSAGISALHAPGDLRFRELSLANAPHTRFYLTSTYRVGKFGKFVLACSADGYACGAKVIRTQESSRKDGKNRHGRDYTVAMPAAAIDAELQANYDAGTLPIYANVLLPNHKRMLLLERSNGTIEDVMVDLSVSQCSTLAREMLWSIAMRLRRVHEVGYMHRDVKLDNIHWQTDGSFHLGDFGSAIKATEVRGIDVRGTYPAPHMFTGSGYDRRVDYYAFGASLASLLVPALPNPLLRLSGENALARMKTQSTAFSQWAQGWLAQPWPQPFSPTKGSNDNFYLFFYRMRERDPLLHDFVLREMLLSRRSANDMAVKVLQFATQLQTPVHEASWSYTLARLQDLARQGHAERWLRALQDFRAWRQQSPEPGAAQAHGV